MQKLVAFVVVLVGGVSALAQGGPAAVKPEKAAVVKSSTPLDTAKLALEAHGGDKLKKVRSLVVRGAADISFFNQSVPGTFSIVFSGEKYSFELITIVQQMKQVYDGRETYSSVQGLALPPVPTVGFPVLARVGDPGFTVSQLPENLKKKPGFRISTPEGFYTDFIVDEKTGRVKKYESAFEVSGGRVVTTSADIDEMITVDGVILPKKYSQRFDLGTLTTYATFKAKEVLVNSKIDEGFFSLPK